MERILLIEYTYKKKEPILYYDVRLFDDKVIDPDDLISEIKFKFKQEKKEGKLERSVQYSNDYSFESFLTHIMSPLIPTENKSFLLDQLVNIIKSTWRDDIIYN